MALLFHAVQATAQEQANLTTLPPAVPTGKSADPCAFSDRNSLINRVASDWQSYNISLLVETCAGVCALVYGSGNPDISGIGVSVVYKMDNVNILTRSTRQ